MSLGNQGGSKIFDRVKARVLLGRVLVPVFAMSVASNAAAQQREILNPSFEQVNPNGTAVFEGDTPLPNDFTIATEDFFPGWSSTNGQIEIWADGFQNRSASEGSFLAELNPSAPVGLFQEVCLVNGETLNWSFDHSARTSGGAPTLQTVVYEVVDSSNNLIQFLDTNTVTEMGNDNDQSQNAWVTVSDTAVYTGPTGLQRLQFRSTNTGSNGNFLDNIGIDLIPVVTFENLNTSALETATTGLPQFAISGEVPAGFDIQFTITGGTATQGADYTVLSNSISIPTGTYDGVSAGSIFPLPITILTDSIVEGDETILITYTGVTPSTVAVLTGPNCSSAAIEAIHTILDVPLSLELEKVLSSNKDEDGSGSVSIGDTLNYEIIATNTGDAAQNNVIVSDALITPDTQTCAIVAVNGTCTLTGTYVVTSADSGEDFVNTASVVSDELPTLVEDTVTTPVDPAAPSFVMTKVADSEGPFTAGDTITYTYTVTNDGNVNINDVSVSDTHNGSGPAPTPENETLLTDAAPTGDSSDAGADGTWDILAPGDAVTFTGSYTVSAEDAENL